MSVRRLPLPLAPGHQESLASYVRRLADVHDLYYPDLWHHLSDRPRAGRLVKNRRLIVAERLAAAVGRPITQLAPALPELRDPPPDWNQLRQLPQRACPRCTARHPGGPIARFHLHHEYVCTRHRHWIGPVEPTDLSVTPRALGDLVTAQHRHRRLVRQHGWRVILDAFDASTAVCIQQPPNPAASRRSTELITETDAFNTTIYLAIHYPEIVKLSSLFVAPGIKKLAFQAFNSTTATAEINELIANATGGVAPNADRWRSGELLTWMQAAINTPTALPSMRFPHTRQNTIDGVPDGPSAESIIRCQTAQRHFRDEERLPAWTLPLNTSRQLPGHRRISARLP